MQINQPHSGVFKGFGKLAPLQNTQRKPFPHIRNRSDLSFSVEYRNDYKTSAQHFALREQYTKPLKYHPKDKLNLSHFQTISAISQNKSQFQKYQNAKPPSLYRENEKGTGIFENEQRTGEMGNRKSSTHRDTFLGNTEIDKKMNISYRYGRQCRPHPINGNIRIAKGISGYEDYSPDMSRQYRANNPVSKEKFNILNGRTIE